MRKPRKKYQEMTPVLRWKMSIRMYSLGLLKRGVIQKKPCEVCGCELSEMHHDNYVRPEQVTFLCTQHHKQRHSLLYKCPITKIIEQQDIKHVELLAHKRRLIKEFEIDIKNSGLPKKFRDKFIAEIKPYTPRGVVGA